MIDVFSVHPGFYFIRHGDGDFLTNAQGEMLTYHDGIGLSLKGKADIDSLADRLLTEGIQALYSSSLQRARESALRIAGRLGIDFDEKRHVSSDLDELRAPGWKGVPLSELRAVKNNVYLHAREGQEGLQAFANRITHAVDSILSQEHTRKIAFVGHGGPFSLWWLLKNRPGFQLDERTIQAELDKDFLPRTHAWKITHHSEYGLQRETIAVHTRRAPEAADGFTSFSFAAARRL